MSREWQIYWARRSMKSISTRMKNGSMSRFKDPIQCMLSMMEGETMVKVIQVEPGMSREWQIYWVVVKMLISMIKGWKMLISMTQEWEILMSMTKGWQMLRLLTLMVQVIMSMKKETELKIILEMLMTIRSFLSMCIKNLLIVLRVLQRKLDLGKKRMDLLVKKRIRIVVERKIVPVKSWKVLIIGMEILPWKKPIGMEQIQSTL